MPVAWPEQMIRPGSANLGRGVGSLKEALKLGFIRRHPPVSGHGTESRRGLPCPAQWALLLPPGRAARCAWGQPWCRAGGLKMHQQSNPAEERARFTSRC